MSDQTPEQIQLLEAFLRAHIATQEAERARVDAERARIDALLAQYQNSLADLMRIGALAVAASPQASPHEQESFEAESPKGGLFAGLLLTDAIAKYLSLNKAMLSVKEIWAALEKAGFKVLSGHPTRAVSEALRKRAHRRGDVFSVGNRWGATENFSAGYVRRVAKKHAGMGGKTAGEHGAKTSAGIERRRADGGRIGAPLFMTPERIEEAQRRLIAGESIAKIARDWGCSRQTLYTRFKRKDIIRLREKAAAATDAEGNRPSLRVVK